MKLLSALVLSSIFVGSYADSAPSIADYTQGLSPILSSTELNKHYLPVTFSSVNLTGTYNVNKNINSTNGSAGGNIFNIIVDNAGPSPLYVYFAGSVQSVGTLANVSYCAVSASLGSVNFNAPNNPLCVDPATASSSAVFLYVSTSQSAYSIPAGFNSCAPTNANIQFLSNPVGYQITNDHASSYSFNLAASSCTIVLNN